MRFFEHHGEPDEGHHNDSNMLLAMQITNDADRELVRAEVAKSLFLRAAVWTEMGEKTARL